MASYSRRGLLPGPAAGTVLVRAWRMFARIPSTVSGESGCGSCVGLCLGLLQPAALDSSESALAHDRAPEDALEQHHCFALRRRADLRSTHLLAEVLDGHWRDLTQLVVAEARQQMSAPHLEVASARVGCEVRDRVARPPLVLDELGERLSRLDDARGQSTQLFAPFDVDIEGTGILGAEKLRESFRPPSVHRTSNCLPRFRTLIRPSPPSPAAVRRSPGRRPSLRPDSGGPGSL